MLVLAGQERLAHGLTQSTQDLCGPVEALDAEAINAFVLQGVSKGVLHVVGQLAGDLAQPCHAKGQVVLILLVHDLDHAGSVVGPHEHQRHRLGLGMLIGKQGADGCCWFGRNVLLEFRGKLPAKSTAHAIPSILADQVREDAQGKVLSGAGKNRDLVEITNEFRHHRLDDVGLDAFHFRHGHPDFPDFIRGEGVHQSPGHLGIHVHDQDRRPVCTGEF